MGHSFIIFAISFILLCAALCFIFLVKLSKKKSYFRALWIVIILSIIVCIFQWLPFSLKTFHPQDYDYDVCFSHDTTTLILTEEQTDEWFSLVSNVSVRLKTKSNNFGFIQGTDGYRIDMSGSKGTWMVYVEENSNNNFVVHKDNYYYIQKEDAQILFNFMQDLSNTSK